MHSYYVGGNKAAKDMSDQDAETYAGEHNIGKARVPVSKLIEEASFVSITKEETHDPEQIDTVVITTDHVDGPLLRRAVIHALGPDAEIKGGMTLSMFWAADGAARSALKIHGSWVEMRRIQGYDTNVFEHTEL